MKDRIFRFSMNIAILPKSFEYEIVGGNFRHIHPPIQQPIDAGTCLLSPFSYQFILIKLPNRVSLCFLCYISVHYALCIKKVIF